MTIPIATPPSICNNAVIVGASARKEGHTSTMIRRLFPESYDFSCIKSPSNVEKAMCAQQKAHNFPHEFCQKTSNGIGSPPIIHLVSLNISPYDYLYKNKDDDFLRLFDALLSYDIWILASPVYWYSLSAHMKIFFDRMTDILIHHKDKKSALQGKKVMLLSTSAGPCPKYFHSPVEATCEYLGMHYIGNWSMIMPETEGNKEFNQEQEKSFLRAWCALSPDRAGSLAV